VVRAGTPPEIVRKVQRDIAEALQSEDVQSKLPDSVWNRWAIRRGVRRIDHRKRKWMTSSARRTSTKVRTR
jgi:hypothetical protein